MGTLFNLIIIYAICYILNVILLSFRFWNVDRKMEVLLIMILSLYGPQLLITMLIFRIKGSHIINKYNINTNDRELW